MTQFDANVQLQNNVIAIAQNRIIKHLLHDTCTITPATGANRTTSRDGIASWDAPVNREYNGSDVIPCRADAQSSFRPEELRKQVSTVDELDLHLPHDMGVTDTDVVTLNGYKYKIRKLVDDSTHDLTKVAKIMRVTTELDT